MTNTSVKFRIDKKLDKEVGLDFINKRIGGYDFGKDRIINSHPDLKNIRKLKKIKLEKELNSYIDEFYKLHKKDILESLTKTEKVWQKIEKKYFKEIEKLFRDLNFYKPKTITAYLSIFKCGVLCDDGKSFQLWHEIVNRDSAEVKRHVAHEVLHFYYYSYLKKKGYQKLAKNWDLAEIFNVVILNLSQFRNLTNKKELGYTIHRRRFQKYKKMWQQSKDLDDYLVKAERSIK